ncbi:unnamed protein product [Lactuca saligna]|uniref:PHD-type domain-containing protein n=1 Tax=Lactuca saligna TaxID=75948 RepID=A0AA36A2S2_LACSI|nr:unnamed protein product [Lactuca saligna]
MMAQAIEKLADVCKKIAPKYVFPKDAFGTIIEDLAPKLGIRPPKLSISELIDGNKIRWKNMRCSHYTLLLHMLLELFHQIKQITHPIHLQDCIIIQQFFMLPQFQIRELYHINCPLAVILEGILPSLRSGRPHLRSDEIFNYHRAPITHKEISKFVEKILQAQITEQQKWTPPSRDYMNKPLTCQTCKTTITKVDTTLVCDACEKGYHLKCLHYIPKSFSSDKWQDWHCVKCLSITNGKRKALPPKYGPVITS